MLFKVCLSLLDQDDGRISLLKNLNETLLKTQMFDQKLRSWESIAQMKSKILDFELEIKDNLAKLLPK